ncbi:hypothetical protein SK803_39390 [Lentzea sp. BCCO 10_0856]|uniref:Uncharacterized protein n=1 Tax=Lentzea miocenica TaxID=3095431 RepID=A0ABU4TDP6_9PSEU|nr:hypothetical protein [Lentzea sp. BCCO 10_0856]MDX8036298.1 hypothetical protein [Lentzea sp. BCCO 10_0856]
MLSGLLRVLEPGGLLRIGEPDWDGLTVDGDLEMNRADGGRWLTELQAGDFLAAPLMFLLAARKPW